jgi:GNAT superfamily N-acetyltransferase
VEVGESGNLRGYASISRCLFHGNPYVEFLFVLGEFRRQAVATHLLTTIEAVHRGRRLFISTEEPNEAMLQLLARRGYTRAGALQGLNDDHGGAAEIFYYRDL